MFGQFRIDRSAGNAKLRSSLKQSQSSKMQKVVNNWAKMLEISIAFCVSEEGPLGRIMIDLVQSFP